MMKVVLITLLIASTYAEVRLTTLTASQGATAVPVQARADPCADNILLNVFSGTATTGASRICATPRTTDSQTTFYGPSITPAPAAPLTITIAGIGLASLIQPGAQLEAGIASGSDCSLGAIKQITLTPSAAPARAILTGTVVIDGTANAWNGVTGFNGYDIELEDVPRDICLRFTAQPGTIAVPFLPGGFPTNQWFYSGFRWKVQRYCQANTDCLAAPPATLNLNPLQAAIYTARTTCCGRVCINPSTHSCCTTQLSRLVEKAAEKCCDNTRGLTAFIHQACECYSNTQATSNTAPVCPTEESECCLPSKFGELFPRDCASANPFEQTLCSNVRGQCYNPRVHRCCSNGGRYDPGSQQCCKITGVQSLDSPCPCSADTDCQQDNKAQFQGNANTYAYSQDGLSRQRCCIRTTPAAPPQTTCSPYVNYPAASTVRLVNTQCSGTCIDTRYQVCCNGVACRREFERCCNTTCCNRFSGTCTQGRKVATARHYANSREFKIPQDYCTTIEKLDEVRSFWIFILPAALLLATLGSLGFALVFANKAANRLFSFIEKLIIGISVAVVLLGSLLFFSPAYKYGMFINLVGILAILTAAARVKWFNAFTTISLVVLLFYIINPFDGNNYLTFNYLRLPGSGEADAKAHGLFHLLTRMYPRFQSENNLCVNWYQGYFRFDVDRYSALETNIRNPTFAYCSRGFLTGLLIVSAINLVLLVALFILSIFGLVLRFRKQYNIEAPVELTPFPLY